MVQVDVREDGSERVKYDYEGYAAYIRRGQLSKYANFAADSHWHDELELISVLSGCMEYSVNGTRVCLQAGEGILVNARQLHHGFSAEQRECEFYCVLLHPMLLCASPRVEQALVTPILADGALPYVHLDGRIAWQREILEDVATIYSRKEHPLAPLYIQSAFYHIWLLLAEHTVRARPGARQDRGLSALKSMLTFIQGHYTGRVTLDEIAKAGNVSKSSCLLLFKKYLRETPIRYLNEYRLKQAIKLLEGGELTVTEVALEVGFCSAAYFAEIFRRFYGCSPRAYRRK